MISLAPGRSTVPGYKPHFVAFQLGAKRRPQPQMIPFGGAGRDEAVAQVMQNLLLRCRTYSSNLFLVRPVSPVVGGSVATPVKLV